MYRKRRAWHALLIYVELFKASFAYMDVGKGREQERKL